MSKRIVQVPVTWDSANRKKDKSVGLRFTTNLEVNNQDFAEMDTMINHAGWLLFAENELDQKDVPNEDAINPSGKSPSQRLYNILFVAWNELTDKATPFEYWRIEQMEKIIEGYKRKLPER